VNILETIGNFSALGVAALSLVVLLVYIRRGRNKNNNHEKRINIIEDNDIKHIEGDLADIKGDINKLQSTISLHGERLAKLETKICQSMRK